MPRKTCLRYIREHPEITFYKPAGIPMKKLSEVIVHLDEFEALRLADAEGMYQVEAANKMGVSRQTFGRIISRARAKLAEAIVAGKVIRIEGGNVNIQKMIAHENSHSHPE